MADDRLEQMDAQVRGRFSYEPCGHDWYNMYDTSFCGLPAGHGGACHHLHVYPSLISEETFWCLVETLRPRGVPLTWWLAEHHTGGVFLKANEAARFRTRQECEGWINRLPKRPKGFWAVEHMWYDSEPPPVSAESIRRRTKK